MIYESLSRPDFQDERGTITDILYKQDFQHATLINTPNASPDKPVIRGNHYHKLSTQAIYVISGALTYWYKDAAGRLYPNAERVVAPAGTLITTQPFEVHALEIREPTLFIAFSNGLRGGQDYESDTYRVPNIVMNDWEI